MKWGSARAEHPLRRGSLSVGFRHIMSYRHTRSAGNRTKGTLMAEQRQESRRSFIKRAAVIGGAATFGAGGRVARLEQDVVPEARRMARAFVARAQKEERLLPPHERHRLRALELLVFGPNDGTASPPASGSSAATQPALVPEGGVVEAPAQAQGGSLEPDPGGGS